MDENKEKRRSITELGDPSKPHGEAGREMLGGMNEHHSGVTGWALEFFDFHGSDRVLDIGCGGGEALRRMAEHITDGHLTGADHSELSVKMSKEHNADSIASGKMDVIRASVSSLPFECLSFDKIITVESFYFWNDPQNDLKEVFRVLAPNGKLLIAADINGDAELSDEDRENIEKYGLFNPTSAEFEGLLSNAGFTDIVIHKKDGTSWICAEGNKGSAE